MLTTIVLIRNTYFNGQAVTYDEIGNPITFGSKPFEWWNYGRRDIVENWKQV